MIQKQCVAMILAGGQGSRLGALTKSVAKPAVPFGGKYRIIDFPLSNCAHSGIDTVGVLTQYQPLELNTYIGNGSPWDLDRNHGGAYVLPPYQKAESGEWYKGTANAIYQNLEFLEKFHPEHVLILSGDHIYKMNYGKMLAKHIKSDAAATIAVMPVPWDEASRFGIMNVNEGGEIVEFEEKPQNPKSNLASMGIYIFKYEALKQYLQEDEQDPSSANDFGKNIIPKMLADGEVMQSYSFEGYWKDVGTVYSLWEANMDLLDESQPFDLSDRSWIIYSRNAAHTPHFTAKGAAVHNSMITEGCSVYGTVEHSVVFGGVTIGKGSVVKDSVIMPGTVIGENVTIEKAVIGSDVIISDGVKVGVKAEGENPYQSPMCSNDLVLIGNDVSISMNREIACNSMIARSI